jgi:hypothetical protein
MVNWYSLTTEHSSAGLEWPFEVAFCRFAENVNGDGLGVVNTLHAHESLHEEWLGVFKIDMHEGHHRNSDVDSTKKNRDLLKVVFSIGGGDEGAWFLGLDG